MSEIKYFPDWEPQVAFVPDGPKPNFVVENDKVRIIMAGLEAGQKIPEHPEKMAVYHFLTGNGWMIVNGERMAVSAGSTIYMPEGTVRGMEAETRMAFLAVRVA